MLEALTSACCCTDPGQDGDYEGPRSDCAGIGGRVALLLPRPPRLEPLSVGRNSACVYQGELHPTVHGGQWARGRRMSPDRSLKRSAPVRRSGFHDSLVNWSNTYTASFEVKRLPCKYLVTLALHISHRRSDRRSGSAAERDRGVCIRTLSSLKCRLSVTLRIF